MKNQDGELRGKGHEVLSAVWNSGKVWKTQAERVEHDNGTVVKI